MKRSIERTNEHQQGQANGGSDVLRHWLERECACTRRVEFETTIHVDRFAMSYGADVAALELDRDDRANLGH